MKTITATELARKLRQVLDSLVAGGEEILVERNHQLVARILPGPGRRTALEALADLYRTLPEDAAAGWEADGKGMAVDQAIDSAVRDPWVV